MPANGRWDLIRRSKVKVNLKQLILLNNIEVKLKQIRYCGLD